MTSYLQTWTDGATGALEYAGEPLTHAASNQYMRMGVVAGDRLYIAYLDRRHLHLLGRLTVDRILTHRQAERLLGQDVWIAESHAIGTGTDRARFDVRVPDDVLRSLRFVRGDERTVTTLAVAHDGTVNGQALQSIRRLTTGSAALLDEVLDVGADDPPAGGRTGEANRAVEQHAMALVRAHYEAAGWTVDDVSDHRPYDFVCHRGVAEVHVEVKGLSGPPARIHLTANEVEHARTCPHVVLAVVSEIETMQSAPAETAGGRLELHDPWRVEDGRLRATAYTYALTPPTRPVACPECGSTRTAPLVVGLPAPETEVRARRGEVFLVGDVLEPRLVAADRGCLDCRHVWRSRV
jgi:hypothetical protein